MPDTATTGTDTTIRTLPPGGGGGSEDGGTLRMDPVSRFSSLSTEEEEPNENLGPEAPEPDLVLRGILEDLTDFATDYAVFPSPYAAEVLALWVAHSWTVTRFDSTPRLAILSAEKGSGKTRVLEVLEVLVREPLRASDVSAATLFRVIEKRRPTLLLDESDLLFGPASDGADSVRQIVNAGYRVGNPVLRCVGQNFEPTEFETFGPVALAGLGDLPETILDRSVIVRIRRRAKSEPVKRWRLSQAVPRGHALRDRLEEWSRDEWEPQYPDDESTISDRLADVWEPLFVLADRAGGEWPERVREAVFDLTETVEVETLALRLLREIRAEWPRDKQWWGTSDLILTLQSLEEGPWAPGGPFGERGLTPHRLSRMLHGYRIASVHNTDRSRRGFLRYDFLDAWDRYLPPLPDTPGESVHTVEASMNPATEAAQRLREPR